jgi:hypothetical protein
MASKPGRQRLARGAHGRGDARDTHAARDDAAHDGARGVAVAERGHRLPQRLFVVVGVTTDQPAAERHRVPRRDARAVAEALRGQRHAALAERLTRLLDALTHVGAWGHGEHVGHEGRGVERLPPRLARKAGRGGDGHGPRDALGVSVGDLGAALGLGTATRIVITEERPQGRHPHGGAVSERAHAAKESPAHVAPALAHLETLQQALRPWAVPTHGIEALNEALGQRVLIDRAVLAQHLHQGQGHLRVIGIAPRGSGNGPLVDGRVERSVRHEEPLAKGVAHRETQQRDQRAFESRAHVSAQRARWSAFMPSEDAVRVEALSTGPEHMLSLVASG